MKLDKQQIERAIRWLREHADICKGFNEERIGVDDLERELMESPVVCRLIADHLEATISE